jgi:hypothetical protein
MVIVRRSTLTILSIIGQIIIRPGPLTGISLPSLKMTPLSYSRKILIALERKNITTTIKKILVIVNCCIFSSLSPCFLCEDKEGGLHIIVNTAV